MCTPVPTQQVGGALAQSPGPVVTTPVPWTACVVPEASKGCRGLQGWLWLQVRAVRGLLLLLLGTSPFPMGLWGQPPALCICLLLGLFHESLLDRRGSESLLPKSATPGLGSGWFAGSLPVPQP